MIHLRLFKASDPFREIECRELRAGSLVIGSDPSADWTIHDARGDLSRNHCVISMDDGSVFLLDTSKNGVDVGADETPAPRGAKLKINQGESIFLGEYVIIVDVDGPAEASLQESDCHPTIPWVGPRGASPRRESGAPPTDAALLEAFCCGAGLEPSSFAGEDPLEVMLRLGAAYRAVVDDLSSLMQDRATLRNQLHLDRTTISARDNNPLKWASPEQVAVDLLREDGAGFLKGADAFRASFADLRRHSAGLLAGANAAVRHVLNELQPDAIAASVKRQPLHFVTRFEAADRRLRELHVQLVTDAAGEGAGQIERAFRKGYEERLRAQDGEAA
jgi:predicted component of type VI protein secretion system